jgi:hypothetical protein
MSFDERPRDPRTGTTGLSSGTLQAIPLQRVSSGPSVVGWLEDMTAKLDPFYVVAGSDRNQLLLLSATRKLLALRSKL